MAFPLWIILLPQLLVIITYQLIVSLYYYITVRHAALATRRRNVEPTAALRSVWHHRLSSSTHSEAPYKMNRIAGGAWPAKHMLQNSVSDTISRWPAMPVTKPVISLRCWTIQSTSRASHVSKQLGLATTRVFRNELEHLQSNLQYAVQ
jgi:hypothetical protein